jgi:acyl-CoA synthetase (AMP-forming)/AMP-acid ligase II
MVRSAEGGRAHRRRRSRRQPFEGYTDPAETEKKVLRDVFAEGDAWFRTGDLMLCDEQGYSISSTGSATHSAGRARTSRPAR